MGVFKILVLTRFLVSEVSPNGHGACRIVRLSRSVHSRPLAKDEEAALKCQLASENRRCGYLRLHAMLRLECAVVNHKSTYGLYTEQDLRVRTQKRRKLPRRDCVAPQVPKRPM
jgi:putative transposase